MKPDTQKANFETPPAPTVQENICNELSGIKNALYTLVDVKNREMQLNMSSLNEEPCDKKDSETSRVPGFVWFWLVCIYFGLTFIFLGRIFNILEQLLKRY